MSGKLIRMFLVDGKANGMKTIEISNMTIYATMFPRPLIKEYSQRESASKPGVYILIGPDINNADDTMVYIGEGDPVLPRLKSHFSKKDFWTEAIAFTSKDNYLTKTQIQYLEAELVSIAKSANRVALDNTQSPSKPNISEVDTAEVQDFLNGIRLILEAMGIEILVPSHFDSGEFKESEDSEIVFELTNNDAHAYMKIIGDKYVVLKGSTAVKDNRNSVANHIKTLRQKLIDSKSMILDEDGLYHFVEDYAFNSPSYAGAAIVGGNMNGQKKWKYNGESLSKIQESQLE